MIRFFFLPVAFVMLLVHTIAGQDIIYIDPEHTSRGTFTLSDMVESIEYIQLETNSDCLIGDIRKADFIKFSDKYILVNCITSDSHYLFSRTGKYIAKIGNSGNGPSDYPMHSRPLNIDEKNQRIIIMSPPYYHKVMYYDLNGKYIQSVAIDDQFCGYGGPTVQFAGNYISMHTNNPAKAGIPPFNYLIFSGDYKLITQKIKNADYTILQKNSEAFFVPVELGFCHYFYNGQLHVKKLLLNDTVFYIGQNLSFFPKYILNTGRYSLTKQILSDPDLYQSKRNNCVFPLSVFETDKYVLISYLYREKYFYQYYDKSQRRSMLFNSSASGISNDYDGGLDFWPKQQNGNELVTWYNAYLFKENGNKIKLKGPQNAIENQKKMTMELDSEDNPIIVIVKLKQ